MVGEQALRELAASAAPFDSWYGTQMRRLFGCDLAHVTARVAGSELLSLGEKHRARVRRDHRKAREPTPYFVEDGTRKARGEGEVGGKGIA
jgi:hypothetical protein